MQRGQKSFGRRRAPIAEFRSREEEHKEGELSKRRKELFAPYLTPLLAIAVVATLIFSPESRALALEIGAKSFQLGRKWILRGLLE
jgi:hypothetical protein